MIYFSKHVFERKNEMIDSIKSQVANIKEAWGVNSIPEDLGPYGFPGLNRALISDALGGVVVSLEQLGDSDVDLITLMSLNQTLTSLSAYVNQHIPSNPIPHLPEFFRLLEVLRSTVKSWGNGNKRALPNLTEKLADANSRMSDAAVIYNSLQSAHQSINELALKSKALVEKIEKNSNVIAQFEEVSKTSLDNLKLTTIENFQEIEASAAQSQQAIAALQEQAGIEANEITAALAKAIELKEALDQHNATLIVLQGDMATHNEQITKILGDANRTGMAHSFISSKAAFESQLVRWQIFFAISIGLLACAAFFAVGLSLENPLQAILHLLLASPLVWLTWFCAKQYGYTFRLKVEYEYKAASAMAYEGYKKEIADVSPELLAKLADTAVANLSHHPLRIFESKNDHASPLHEAMDKLLKDDKMLGILSKWIEKISIK